MFLKTEKLEKFVTDAGRQLCEFLDVRTTGMHSILTSCSCVISIDLTVCHKQIAEEGTQQIIVVAKHKVSSIERINLENI